MPREIKFYTVEELLKRKVDSSKWILPNLVPRIGRTAMFGEGGCFKSCSMFDLAVAVASGGLFLEQFSLNAYGPVTVFSVEGSLGSNIERIKYHMRTRNLHPSVINLHYVHQRITITNDEDFDVLRQSVKELQPALLVIDPFVNSFDGNENLSQDVVKWTKRLDDLLEIHPTSLLIIHHANKAGGLRGNTALWGWYDCISSYIKEKGVCLPGIPRPVDVVTITAEKTRDGIEGKMLSIVPFINEQIGLTTFGVYNNADCNGVVVAYLKQNILKYLQESKATLTEAEVIGIFRMPRERVVEALNWLTRDGLIEREWCIRTGDGGRRRKTEGWRTTPVSSRVDVARAMLMATEDNREGGSDDVIAGELG